MSCAKKLFPYDLKTAGRKQAENRETRPRHEICTHLLPHTLRWNIFRWLIDLYRVTANFLLRYVKSDEEVCDEIFSCSFIRMIIEKCEEFLAVHSYRVKRYEKISSSRKNTCWMSLVIRHECLYLIFEFYAYTPKLVFFFCFFNTLKVQTFVTKLKI